MDTSGDVTRDKSKLEVVKGRKRIIFLKKMWHQYDDGITLS